MTLKFHGHTREGHVIFATDDGKTVVAYRTLALALEAFGMTGRAFLL